MNHLQPISRFRVSALSAGLFMACAGLILGPAHPAQAALVDGAKGPQFLIRLDDDRQDNAAIQAGAVANQSLNRTDVLEGVVVGRPRVDRDLRVEKAFLPHHVSKDFFEATECLRFKRQPSRRSTPFERNPSRSVTYYSSWSANRSCRSYWESGDTAGLLRM